MAKRKLTLADFTGPNNINTPSPTNTYGIADRDALQAFAWGQDYDVEARRNAIAAAMLAQQVAAPGGAAAPGFDQLTALPYDYRLGGSGDYGMGAGDTPAATGREPGNVTQDKLFEGVTPERSFWSGAPPPPGAPPDDEGKTTPEDNDAIVASIMDQIAQSNAITQAMSQNAPATSPDFGPLDAAAANATAATQAALADAIASQTQAATAPPGAVTQSGIPAGDRTPSMFADQIPGDTPPSGNVLTGVFDMFGNAPTAPTAPAAPGAAPTGTPGAAGLPGGFASAGSGQPGTVALGGGSVVTGTPGGTILGPAPGEGIVSASTLATTPGSRGWGDKGKDEGDPNAPDPNAPTPDYAPAFDFANAMASPVGGIPGMASPGGFVGLPGGVPGGLPGATPSAPGSAIAQGTPGAMSFGGRGGGNAALSQTAAAMASPGLPSPGGFFGPGFSFGASTPAAAMDFGATPAFDAMGNPTGWGDVSPAGSVDLGDLGGQGAVDAAGITDAGGQGFGGGGAAGGATGFGGMDAMGGVGGMSTGGTGEVGSVADGSGGGIGGIGGAGMGGGVGSPGTGDFGGDAVGSSDTSGGGQGDLGSGDGGPGTI